MALEGPAKDFLGIACQILATFMAALAYVLQKKAHGDENPNGIYRNKKWLFGFLLMVLTALLDVYSFSLLDQSKLAAFGAVTMAWNVLLSSAFLKEKFTRIDAVAVLVIATGTILALTSAEATSKDFTLDEIVGLLNDDFVYIYSSVVGVGIIAAALSIERITKKDPESWSATEKWAVMVGSPFVGGLFMGFTGYAAKAISATLFHADWHQFEHLPLYVYILIGGTAVSGQVRYLNKGLEFFDAMSIVPVFEAAIILSNSLAGIVYYRDLRDESTSKKIVFALGACMSIGGVNILLLKNKKAAGDVGDGETQQLRSKSPDQATGRSSDSRRGSKEGYDEENIKGRGRLSEDPIIPLVGGGIITGVEEVVHYVSEGMSGGGGRSRGRSHSALGLTGTGSGSARGSFTSPNAPPAAAAASSGSSSKGGKGKYGLPPLGNARSISASAPSGTSTSSSSGSGSARDAPPSRPIDASSPLLSHRLSHG